MRADGKPIFGVADKRKAYRRETAARAQCRHRRLFAREDLIVARQRQHPHHFALLRAFVNRAQIQQVAADKIQMMKAEQRQVGVAGLGAQVARHRRRIRKLRAARKCHQKRRAACHPPAVGAYPNKPRAGEQADLGFAVNRRE